MKGVKNFIDRIVKGVKLYHNWLLGGLIIANLSAIIEILFNGVSNTSLLWIILSLLLAREYREAVYDYTIEQEYRKEGL